MVEGHVKAIVLCTAVCMLCSVHIVMFKATDPMTKADVTREVVYDPNRGNIATA
jgi:hypothetical protein